MTIAIFNNFFQTTFALPGNLTVVETVTGLFRRRNLTLDDPPLVAINCTWNCGPEMWIVRRTMTFDVCTGTYLFVSCSRFKLYNVFIFVLWCCAIR